MLQYMYYTCCWSLQWMSWRVQYLKTLPFIIKQQKTSGYYFFFFTRKRKFYVFSNSISNVLFPLPLKMFWNLPSRNTSSRQGHNPSWASYCPRTPAASAPTCPQSSPDVHCSRSCPLCTELRRCRTLATRADWAGRCDSRQEFPLHAAVATSVSSARSCWAVRTSSSWIAWSGWRPYCLFRCSWSSPAWRLQARTCWCCWCERRSFLKCQQVQ